MIAVSKSDNFYDSPSIGFILYKNWTDKIKLADWYWGQDVYTAFLSHASDDEDVATRICERLRNGDITVFYSPDSIQASEHFPSALANGLNNSRVFVLLVSESSLQSGWVREEVDTAASVGMSIIPVYLKPVEFPSFNPIAIHLKYVQRLSVYADFDGEMETLIKLIQQKTSKNVEAQLSVDTQSVNRLLPQRSPSPEDNLSKTPINPTPSTTPKVEPTVTPSQSSVKSSNERPKPNPKKPVSNEEYQQLLERLTRDVDRGDKEAAYFLSRAYANGLYVRQDDGRAVRYLQLAASGKRCMPEAIHDLAEMYRLGKGVGKSGKKSIELHEKAAKLEFAPSFYRLARIYQQGEIAERNLTRAYRRFYVAGKLNYAPALYRLAEIHWLGAGADIAHDKAFKYAEMAAAKHLPAALNLIGRFYRKGVSVEQDDAEACNWYERAMLQGSAEGAYNLASMYKRGIGRQKDEVKAQRYLDVSSQFLAGADPNAVLKDLSLMVETVSHEGPTG